MRVVGTNAPSHNGRVEEDEEEEEGLKLVSAWKLFDPEDEDACPARLCYYEIGYPGHALQKHTRGVIFNDDLGELDTRVPDAKGAPLQMMAVLGPGPTNRTATKWLRLLSTRTIPNVSGTIVAGVIYNDMDVNVTQEDLDAIIKVVREREKEVKENDDTK